MSQSSIHFQPIKGQAVPRLFVANDGEGRYRVTFFKSAFNTNQDIERVPNTNIFILGGEATKQLLANLLSEHGRPTVNEMVSGGITGRPYTHLRAYLNITAHSQHDSYRAREPEPM